MSVQHRSEGGGSVVFGGSGRSVIGHEGAASLVFRRATVLVSPCRRRNNLEAVFGHCKVYKHLRCSQLLSSSTRVIRVVLFCILCPQAQRYFPASRLTTTPMSSRPSAAASKSQQMFIQCSMARWSLSRLASPGRMTLFRSSNVDMTRVLHH